MKNKDIIITLLMAFIIPMATACRSTKHISSTQSSTTKESSASIDSAVQHMSSEHHKTTTITVLPVQPTTPLTLSPEPLTLDQTAPEKPLQDPIADVLNQLLQQGGGTIIIQEDEQLQQDQESISSQTSTQDVFTTQNSTDEQNITNPSRASPVLNRLLWLLIAASVFIIALKFRTRQ